MSVEGLRRARESAAQTLALIDAEIALLHREGEPLVVAPAAAPPAPAPPSTTGGLQNPAAFFAELRISGILGADLSKEEVEGCQSVLDAAAGVLPLPWCAYALATTHHETGAVMKGNVENLNYTTPERIKAVWPSRFPTVASAAPFVRNAKGLANHVYNGRMGNRVGSNDGWDYRGRGQSHITGREMYEKADRELGLGGTMVANPDRALEPEIAARILVIGMRDGWFTGKSFRSYINNSATLEQFTKARAIINPDRNGDKVAKAAIVFMAVLKAGAWT